MLTEQQRQELEEIATSSASREEFEQRSKAAQLDPTHPVDLDWVIAWLTIMHQHFPLPPPEPFVPYTRVLL